jgi:hypothetical protein
MRPKVVLVFIGDRFGRVKDSVCARGTTLIAQALIGPAIGIAGIAFEDAAGHARKEDSRQGTGVTVPVYTATDRIVAERAGFLHEPILGSYWRLWQADNGSWPFGGKRACLGHDQEGEEQA